MRRAADVLREEVRTCRLRGDDDWRLVDSRTNPDLQWLLYGSHGAFPVATALLEVLRAATLIQGATRRAIKRRTLEGPAAGSRDEPRGRELSIGALADVAMLDVLRRELRSAPPAGVAARSAPSSVRSAVRSA